MFICQLAGKAKNHPSDCTYKLSVCLKSVISISWWGYHFLREQNHHNNIHFFTIHTKTGLRKQSKHTAAKCKQLNKINSQVELDFFCFLPWTVTCTDMKSSVVSTVPHPAIQTHRDTRLQEWGQREAETLPLPSVPCVSASLFCLSFQPGCVSSGAESIFMQGSGSIYIFQFIYTHYQAKPWQLGNLCTCPINPYAHIGSCATYLCVGGELFLLLLLLLLLFLLKCIF